MDETYLLHFVDQQLDSLTRRPQMWGTTLAVELQTLLLLEVRSVLLRPEFDRHNPRAVRQALAAFVAEKFPDAPGRPIANQPLAGDPYQSLSDLLFEFRTRLVADMHPDNPFEANDLAVVLRLKKGARQPLASSVGGYLEELRRALRGILRQKTTGRTARELEEVTDFDLTNVSVVPANGAPGRVVLPLQYRPPAQVTTAHVNAADVELQHALADVAATVQWAAGGAAVEELAAVLTDSVQRGKVATQTLRLMPRGNDVDFVELGGRLFSRPDPIRLNRDQKPRVKMVRMEGFSSVPIIREGSVRQLDLDDGTFGLKVDKKTRIRCVLSDWDLLPIVQDVLGGSARIVGKEVQPNSGNMFIWVEAIEPIRENEEEDEAPGSSV